MLQAITATGPRADITPTRPVIRARSDVMDARACRGHPSFFAELQQAGVDGRNNDPGHDSGEMVQHDGSAMWATCEDRDSLFE